MDFYTNLSFKLQKGRDLWSRGLISKFLDPLVTFEWIDLSASNVGWEMEDWSFLRTNIKMILSGRGEGHVTQFRNFGTALQWGKPPYNFWTNGAIRFKFGTGIEDVPLLRKDHKTTPKWAWTGSRDQFRNFGTLVTFERIELSASNLVQT